MKNVKELIIEMKEAKKNNLEAFCKRVPSYRGFKMYLCYQGIYILKAQKYINGRKFQVYIGTATNLYKFKIDNYITRRGL